MYTIEFNHQTKKDLMKVNKADLQYLYDSLYLFASGSSNHYEASLMQTGKKGDTNTPHKKKPKGAPMPRRPRVEMVGYYHIVNRGVEQRVVYKTPEDFEMFLEIVCNACSLYHVTLHAYALMSNHYHLLIETTQENLSKYMKHLNASYAIYFNKKYKRSGHLWQGRFKSWYVTDESYLYTLIRYIENNPIKAKIVKHLGAYRYSSYRAFVEIAPMLTCMKESFVFKSFQNKNEREAFLQSAIDETLLSDMKKASNLVVTSVKEKVLTPQKLQKMFAKIDTNADRNQTILKAYNEGYSQHAIATALGLSQPYINRIIKKEKGEEV